MNFIEAIKECKKGNRVHRTSLWNSFSNSYLKMSDNDADQFVWVYTNGYYENVAICTGDNILAEDWEIYFDNYDPIV